MAPEEIVASALGVSPSRIDDATSNQSLPEWDSLGHMTLVIELETVYRVSISAEEALGMTSVAAIKRVLSDRGVRW
jgi:acyl carrier protein